MTGFSIVYFESKTCISKILISGILMSKFLATSQELLIGNLNIDTAENTYIVNRGSRKCVDPNLNSVEEVVSLF